MKHSIAGFCLIVSLVSAGTQGQTKGPRAKRGSSKTDAVQSNNSSSKTISICQGIVVPDGYVIVGYLTSSACPHGAYLIKKQAVPTPLESEPPPKPSNDELVPGLPQSPAQATAVSRPRKVGNAQPSPPSAEPRSQPTLSGSYSRAERREPTLTNTPVGGPVSAPTGDQTTVELEKTGPEEVGEGDVVRIETNLVTVPVSVSDRQGRFVPDLRREDFKVFENGNEQPIAYFESTEKPFTVALVLDMSASTHFHLWEIKAAATAFAKQLRPQDRVLVVTFSDQVLLLTEATNNLEVVTAVIEQNARGGDSTRLYDAIDLVINERLNKIPGRKAIVLFTDGVDTSSYLATYESTLQQAEELDALVYPIQYDTSDYLRAMQGRRNATIVTTTQNNWPFPNTTKSQVIYGPPSAGPPLPGSTKADYDKADKYLHQLADKTGARLYQANDTAQLEESFTRISEELRRQYSLGYYPQASTQSGDRRQIKVKVKQPDLAVRARDGYLQRSAPKPGK
jgi:Ca-activated chloride channel homolog